MKRFTVVLAAILVVGATAGRAAAQCSINIGGGTKGKFAMVRDFAGCPSTEHPMNTQTPGGTPACTPVTPNAYEAGNVTPYLYGPKGSCTVSASAKVVPDCGSLTYPDGNSLGLASGACHVTFIKAKCKDILLGGISPRPIDSTDDGWYLATLTRASFVNVPNGPMTIIDFPVTFVFSTPSKGSISIDSNSAQALAPLVTTEAALPTCTSIQLVDVKIKDPLGRPFASIGVATQP